MFLGTPAMAATAFAGTPLAMKAMPGPLPIPMSMLSAVSACCNLASPPNADTSISSPCLANRPVVIPTSTGVKDHAKAQVNIRGGYDYMRHADSGQHRNSWAEWFDLDKQLEYMDGLGHDVDVVCSIGPFSVAFSDMPIEEGRDYAIMWNEEMAGAQKKYPGRLWASAAVPLQDTKVAIEVAADAVNRLGLMGVNLPGSVGEDARIDAERLMPFYAHCDKLGLPLFLHPTDVIFQDILDGYDGALHLGLGRIIEVSVAAMRLILSGVMERHPELKIVLSHTGGALPYQAGRMDKNSKAAKLPKPVTAYMKRMFTDTVSPHAKGIQFAIDYFVIDRVMYGTDS